MSRTCVGVRNLLCAGVMGSLLLANPAAAARTAFVDPSLQRPAEQTAVIVTARSAAMASAAVIRAGGKVTSRLWLIDGVGAVVSPRALERLRSDAAVATVIENKRVRATEWNGFVSEIRESKGQYPTAGSTAGVANLPDGGFAALAQSGELLLVNADGTERGRVSLAGAPFAVEPVASADGTIYVTSGAKTLLAIASDGSTRWTAPLNNGSRVPVGLGTDVVYTVGESGVVSAFAPSSGALLWQNSIPSGATVTVAPAIDPRGIVYLATTKGDVFAVSSTAVLWRRTLSAGPVSAPQLRNGSIFVTSGSTAYALDGETGATRFSYAATGALGASAVAADGSLYLTTATAVIALSSTGQTRWTYVPADGSLYYDAIPTESGSVLVTLRATRGRTRTWVRALNAASGGVRWDAGDYDELLVPPVADPDGSVLVIEAAPKLRRLAGADGRLADTIPLGGNPSYVSRVSAAGSVVVQLGANALNFVGRVPDHWTRRADVQQGSKSTTYKLANPIGIDVGADVLHKTSAGSGYVRGGDTVVAVVDSGVYWDSDTKSVLGPQIQHQFVGQADFVKTQCGGAGTQFADHCFNDYNYSIDTYGHGTHVAGIISNQLLDEPTGTYIGIAPEARILSARVLGADGTGTYESVIKGIQWVVANRATYNVRVLNLSLSAYATVPYFVDPLDRAVERAWLAGIVVLAAAGNSGPFATSITVPGNDPYVITIGSVNPGRTPAYWRDDVVSWWSATGPTYDGFAKPDVLAPGSQIVSYMYNDPTGTNTPTLVRAHPDYSVNGKLFRMNGTSMATAVASGVAALMLQVNPGLSPNQVKYRLMESARLAIDADQQPVFNTLQQGLGRIWAPDAVLGSVDPAGVSNLDMDLAADLAHGYDTIEDLSYHYEGPVRRMTSDDGSTYLYYVVDDSGTTWGLGATDLNGNWLGADAATRMTWAGTRMTWAGTRMTWAGGLSWSGDASSFAATRMTWAGTRMTWAGTRMTWAGTRMTWAGTRMTWAGTRMTWAGGMAWGSTRMTWAGSNAAYSSTRMTWAGAVPASAASSSSKWIGDDWRPPGSSGLPPPAGATP